MGKKSFTLDNVDQSMGLKLWNVANAWQNKLKKRLRSLNLSPLELILLSSLYSLILTRGEATQEHIAKHAQVGKMTVSKTLRALEKKRFIDRKEHEVDTRAKSITINNTGMHTLKRALQLIEHGDDEFFSPLRNKTTVFGELLSILS